MFGSKFSPRLESLDARLCLSATGGEVMAVDIIKPGEEAGAVVDFRTGDERAALVDRNAVDAVQLWDAKPGEEQAALVDRKVGDPGAERTALVDYFHPELMRPGSDPAAERTALVDYFHPTDQLGGPYVGGSGWDKQP